MAKPQGSRVNGVMFVAVLIIATLILRLGYMQVIQGEHYTQMARNNVNRNILIPAPRGLILASGGEIIGRNEIRYEVGIVRDRTRSWERTFEYLAEFFTDEELNLWRYEDDVDPDTDETVRDNRAIVEEKRHQVEKHRRFQEAVILETRLTREMMLKLEEEKWQYPDLRIVERPVRFFDEPNIFPQLVQTLRSDGTPRIETLEYTWDHYLRGIDGREVWRVNANSVPVGYLGTQEAVPGNNLVLTIDLDLQKHTQKVLREGIEENQRRQMLRRQNPARQGAAVVLDVRTGDILAIASYPDYDVHNMYIRGNKAPFMYDDYFGEIDANFNKGFSPGRSQRTNWQQFIPFRPDFGIGSTAKIMTSIIALEEGTITANQRYYDSGKYIPRDSPETTIVNVGGGRGSVNLKESFQVSLNTYFVWMLDALKGSVFDRADLIQSYTDAFGLTADTGFTDILNPEGEQIIGPGKLFREAGARTTDPSRFTLGTQAGVNFSPLHMANLASILANRGYHYRPRLVREVQDHEGNIIEIIEPEIYRIVPQDMVSDKTYDTMHDIMNAVTKFGPRTGTAANAFRGFPYEVAAKTGTAQVASKGDHAWWVGFAPLDEPEIAVVVFIEHGDMHGMVSGMARSIMEQYFGLIEKEAEATTEE